MRNDLLLDEEGDLQEPGGDWVTGDSLEQSQQLLLMTEKGAWKENPDAGVGIRNYLESEDLEGLTYELRRQLVADGLTVNEVKLTNGKVVIDANY